MSTSLLLVRLVLAGSLVLFATAALAQRFVSIDGDVVNVRQRPSTSSPVKWELIDGYPLRVTATRGQWVRVSDFEGELGWVARRLVERDPHHIVRSRIANLRSGPNLRARILAKLERYEVLKTLRRQGGWVHVQRADGQRGWVARQTVWGW